MIETELQHKELQPFFCKLKESGRFDCRATVSRIGTLQGA